jgi:hypothetical protein
MSSSTSPFFQTTHTSARRQNFRGRPDSSTCRDAECSTEEKIASYWIARNSDRHSFARTEKLRELSASEQAASSMKVGPSSMIGLRIVPIDLEQGNPTYGIYIEIFAKHEFLLCDVNCPINAVFFSIYYMIEIICRRFIFIEIILLC